MKVSGRVTQVRMFIRGRGGGHYWNAFGSKRGRVLGWQWPRRMFTRLHYLRQYWLSVRLLLSSTGQTLLCHMAGDRKMSWAWLFRWCWLSYCYTASAGVTTSCGLSRDWRSTSFLVIFEKSGVFLNKPRELSSKQSLPGASEHDHINSPSDTYLMVKLNASFCTGELQF